MSNTSNKYLDREISDIQFIERILSEAHNDQHPLLERLRFLSIAASVLDQFYTVRVARLKHSVDTKQQKRNFEGLTPKQQLRQIDQRGNDLLEAQQQTWLSLKTELGKESIEVLTISQLRSADIDWLESYFIDHILQVITPFSLDEEHPFPFIPSGGICTVLEFSSHYILIPLPSNLPRFVSIPGNKLCLIPLEELIFHFWHILFPDEKLLCYGAFQILRDNDLALKERSDDLRSMIEKGLIMRRKANVTLLRVSESTSETISRFIANRLGLISDAEVSKLTHQQGTMNSSYFLFTQSLIGLSDMSQLIDLASSEKHQHLLFPPHIPRYPQRLRDNEFDIFSTISEKDLLVHWPYESFDVLLEFLQQAAKDPAVMSIKQTLYRTSKNSPIVQSLIEAAENGKAVTVVIELEARDNEDSNIQLAKRLEMAGAQIVYGIVGLKIHCKATFITRKEKQATVNYCHLGTGNYHPGNAKIYSDLSFFTKDQRFGNDVNKVFNYLTSNLFVPTEKLIVAPAQLRQTIYELIDMEIANGRKGKPAQIWAKINSLTDTALIDKLYEASEAGVEIDLVVRRHCRLVPGLAGMSSRIRVKSIVGRFLEHSRIYCFANGDEMSIDSAKIYFASSDWMKRNLDERVEMMVLIEEPTVRKQILEQIMFSNLMDSSQSWDLGSDGEYRRNQNRLGFCAQSWFLKTPNLSGLGSLKDQTAIHKPAMQFTP